MSYELVQSAVDEPIVFLLVASADHITGVTGATPTVTISKNGGAFASPAGTVVEVGLGWYKLVPTAADTNTLGPLILHATAATCDPCDQRYDVLPAPLPPPAPPPSPILAPGVSGAPTFEALWKSVVLLTQAPAMTARFWCQTAINRLHDMRPWSWTFVNAALSWQDARDLSAVTTVRGSTVVTSSGLFVAGDAGRQFRVGTYPIYTITQVVSNSQITLDTPFEPAGNAAAIGVVAAQICDAYATMPANHSSFIVVTDLTNQQVVPWWGTQMDLALIDPMRTTGSSVARFLAAQEPSTYPPTAGRWRYEYWPIPLEEGALNYYARVRPPQMADQSMFTGVVASRLDVLRNGALAEASKWPGTPERKNPYFNLQLARIHEEDFQKGALQLDLRDDDQNPQSIDNVPWQRYAGWAWAFDTHLLQMTDATLGDYFGGFGGWTY